MKKALSILLLLSAIATTGAAQTLALLDNDSIVSNIEPSRTADQIISFHNPGSQPLYLQWSVTTQTFPIDWIVTLCDEGVCHDLPYGNVVRRTLMPGDTNFLHLVAIPNNVPGSLLVVAHLADSLDPGFSQDLIFIVNAQANAVGDPRSALPARVGMSPSQGLVLLQAAKGMLERGSVRLYDLGGKVVLDQAVAATAVQPLDVSRLENGIYLLDYATKSGHLRQKVVLNR